MAMDGQAAVPLVRYYNSSRIQSRADEATPAWTEIDRLLSVAAKPKFPLRRRPPRTKTV
jgi:hypothetical protein